MKKVLFLSVVIIALIGFQGCKSKMHHYVVTVKDKYTPPNVESTMHKASKENGVEELVWVPAAIDSVTTPPYIANVEKQEGGVYATVTSVPFAQIKTK